MAVPFGEDSFDGVNVPGLEDRMEDGLNLSTRVVRSVGSN